MRHFCTAVAAFLFALCSAPAANANASATVFPPAGCSSEEVRIIAWKDGSSSTYCITGQEVFALALPDCNDGDVIVFREGDPDRIPVGGRYVVMRGKFVCEKLPNPPICNTGQFLTFDGTDYTCVEIPICKVNEVLSFTESGFICVVREKDKVPVCKDDEILSSNESGFICIPKEKGSIGGSLCGLAYVTTWEGDGCQSASGTCCHPVIPCNGHNVCNSCPVGYSFSNPGPYYISGVPPTCVKN